MMRLPQANRRQALSTIAGSLANLWISSSLSCIAQPQALKSSIVRYVKPARFRIRHSVTVHDVAKYLAPETKIQSGSDELKNVVARFMGKQRPWVHLAYDLW